MAVEQYRIPYDWLSFQIEQYRHLQPRYQLYAQTLQRIFESAAHNRTSLSIVETRAKELASFSEKIQRKWPKYKDPINQLTDLCGARIITHTYAGVEAICDFIEQHFDIDEINSVNIEDRLRPTEFGYRSIHYVIQLRPGVFPTNEIKINIPAELIADPGDNLFIKAEIQVRTLLEHAWASFSHERVYKGAFTIPHAWQRELAGLAAMLEDADQTFSSIQRGLKTYAATYGAYMTSAQIQNEIELLQVVQQSDPTNFQLAHRIGKLAITLGKWETVVEVLTPHISSGYLPILRDLGMVICKQHEAEPTSQAYRQGQSYLHTACEEDPSDADALASYAGTFKPQDDRMACEYYQRAYRVDPTDPYAMSNYLVCEITQRQDTSIVNLMEPLIRGAMERCQDQVEVGMNQPWAHYSLGLFYLLLGEPYKGLGAYAKAIQLSTASWFIETSLETLRQLESVADSLIGYTWLEQLHLTGLRAKFPETVGEGGVIESSLRIGGKIDGPVIIVAGATEKSVEHRLPRYREFLIEGLRDYRGTIISGGTKSGIIRLVGDLQEAYPADVHTIGYVPTFMPLGIELDLRYRDLRYTQGDDFSALEVLAYWNDLLASGIQPSDVKVVGISGGKISAFEFRIALALGSQVIAVEDSGRAAAELAKDRDWQSSSNLVRIPLNSAVLNALLALHSSDIDALQREAIARSIHDASRESLRGRLAEENPAMVDWDELSEQVKESSRKKADYIAVCLRRIGCKIIPIQSGEEGATSFTDSEIDTLAALEHGRRLAELIQEGVDWSDLPGEVQEWDIDRVQRTSAFLAEVGFEIGRDSAW